MKRLIVDLDNTISVADAGNYAEASVNSQLRDRLIEYRARGFEIVIYSARNMRTYGGNIGKINAYTLPIIVRWLDKYKVPYDEIIIGKPWCGTEGFYIDDRAVRPDEFITQTYEELTELIAQAARRLQEIERIS